MTDILTSASSSSKAACLTSGKAADRSLGNVKALLLGSKALRMDAYNSSGDERIFPGL